jgi:hypothetical protein
MMIYMDVTSACLIYYYPTYKKTNPFIINSYKGNANLSIGVLYKQAVIYIYITSLIEAASLELKRGICRSFVIGNTAESRISSK